MFSSMISHNRTQKQNKRFAKNYEIKPPPAVSGGKTVKTPLTYNDNLRRRICEERSELKKFIFNQIKPPELRLDG